MLNDDAAGLIRIYPALPRPARSREAFFEQWQAHAELARTQPVWAAITDYAQFRAHIRSPSSKTCAGVCVSRLSAPSMLQELKAARGAERILLDELDVFDGPIDAVAVNTRARAIYTDRGVAEAVLMMFTAPNSNVSTTLVEDVLAAAVQVTRVVHYAGLVIEAGRPAPWSGVLEVGFAAWPAAVTVAQRIHALSQRDDLVVLLEPEPMYRYTYDA